MKSIILSRIVIVVLAIFVGLVLRLGIPASLSEGLFRILMYAFYLSVFPTFVWLMIYGSMMITRRSKSATGLDFVRCILTDMIFSGIFMIGAFCWLYFAPRNSGTNVTIYNEGIEKMVNGQFTIAGLHDVIESLFSVFLIWE